MRGVLLLSAILACLSALCAGSNILVVFPTAAHSHWLLGFQLAKGLAAKGHQITFVSPYPQKKPIKNLIDVPVTETQTLFDEVREKLFALETSGAVGNIMLVFDMMAVATEKTLAAPTFQELLASNKKFDAIIFEYFLTDAFTGLGAAFGGAPLIALTATSPSIMINHLVANPAPSSYVPNIGAPLTKRMNFWQRIQNLFFNRMLDGIRHFSVRPKQEAIFNKHFGHLGVKLDDTLYNVSLLLTNSHVSVNDPLPLVQNIVEIGGFHVAPPQPLPADLKTFLDSAKEGVVLFSMGSNLKSKDLKPEVRDSILKAFSKIKQKVLWKFEADIENLPKNVKIMKWLPQNDILAHPNIKAFISHGGLLSTIETVYHGVPVIGIPVFGDQKNNIGSAVANGYAVSVPLPELNEETLSWALDQVLNNPKYAENVKLRSKVMHDRPLKPMDTAIYWVEYVIRHKGATFLRSAGMDLTWVQINMIDIIIFLTLTTIILFVIFYIIIRHLLGLCGVGKTSKVDKSKKRN